MSTDRPDIELESPGLLTVSLRWMNSHQGEVIDHVRSGGAVRVINNVSGTVVAWVFPPSVEPEFYRKFGMNRDERHIRDRARERARVRTAGMRAAKAAAHAVR